MKHSRLVVVSFVAFNLLSCGTLKTRDDVGKTSRPPVKRAEAETFEGSDSPADETFPTPPEPIPVATAMPKVAVILGPGGVKAFAHAGVLKELLKAKIPIEAIVGMEWGALVGGLYAQNGQVHELEWKLYKLQKSDLPGKGLFSSKFKAEPIHSLNEYFERNLKGHSIERSKISFACPSLSLWTGTLVWQDRGELKTVMERCLPYPPLFKPSNPWMAANFAIEESVRRLKKNGYDVIIYVNVMGTGELLQQGELIEEYQSALLWQEIRRYQANAKRLATDVVEVETKQYKLYDFDNRSGLVGLGELAGSRAARKIAEKYGF